MNVEWCDKEHKFTSHTIKLLSVEGRYKTFKSVCDKCGCPRITVVIKGK